MPRTINRKAVLYTLNVEDAWVQRRLLRLLKKGSSALSHKELIRKGYTPARIRQMLRLKQIKEVIRRGGLQQQTAKPLRTSDAALADQTTPSPDVIKPKTKKKIVKRKVLGGKKTIRREKK